jgi:hypothetical protein
MQDLPGEATCKKFNATINQNTRTGIHIRNTNKIKKLWNEIIYAN